MGTDREQLPKIPVRAWLSRLPHNDMRRHLRRTGEQHDNSGQSAQRDFLPCSLYRYPLFLPVQIRRTGEVDFLRALAACQGQGGDFQSEAAKILPDLDAGEPHRIGTGKGHRLTFALITPMGTYSSKKTRERRFPLGVCTRTQRLIQSQDKSSFQPYQTADCMFRGSPHFGLAAFLSAQRQHRHKPCVYGYDCRHAALFPLCHV
ncbi:hypothetical protein HMPREF2747_14950 [Fusobacterium sp. HMSC073F01]|nr:hypothetical protein HMPREF2747_14950 [Fusobacterium sp. HMSC073F01]